MASLFTLFVRLVVQAARLAHSSLVEPARTRTYTGRPLFPDRRSSAQSNIVSYDQVYASLCYSSVLVDVGCAQQVMEL